MKKRKPNPKEKRKQDQEQNWGAVWTTATAATAKWRWLIQGPTIINADYGNWEVSQFLSQITTCESIEILSSLSERCLKLFYVQTFLLIICDTLPEICELFMTSISFEMMNTLTWELIVICSTGVVVVTEDEHCRALPTPPLQACKENQSFSKSVAPATTSTGTHM
jgi:hypothetical protein